MLEIMSKFNFGRKFEFGRAENGRRIYVGLLFVLICLALSIRAEAATVQAQTTPVASPSTTSTSQAGAGSIGGKINNGTARSQSNSTLSGQSVKLERLDTSNRQAQVTEQSVTADPEGNFNFVGLVIGENYRYFVSTSYAGIVYYVEQELKLTPEKPALDVQLKIYETGDDEKSIEFSGASMVIPEADGVSGQIVILEMYSVLNKSDRTFVGRAISSTFATAAQRRTTLRFALAPGATGITPSSGIAPEDIIETADGIEITTPIRPGNNQLVFSYRLPYQGEKLVMPKRFVYDTASFRVFTPLDGVKARSSKLVALSQPVQMGNQKLQGLAGQQFKPNDTLNIELSNLPLPPNKGILEARDFTSKLFVVLITLAIPVFLVVYIRRKLVVAVDPGAEREKLLRWIALSDARYDAGYFDTEKSETEYRQKRTSWKNRLLALAAAEATTNPKPIELRKEETEMADATQ
jgi:hypothetical protein